MPATKPNILFIMTDQQRYDCVGANGNTIIRTPNLDRIAAEGVNVQRYYANAPVCVPARCSTFTGKYLHTHRSRENYSVLEEGREIHLFRALAHEGYSLGYIGKNHLLEAGEWENFDYTDVWSHDHEMSQGEAATQEFASSRSRRMVEAGAWAGATFHDFPPETTRPYVKADSAIRFLRERRDERPFCLTLSFSDPHAPHIAPRKFESIYPLEKMELYPYREGELEEKASRWPIKHRASQADLATEEDKRRFMAVYYAMISWVDEQIGRVLDTIEELGLKQETLVVFTTDHGEFCFEHGMVKKDLVLVESLLHIPLLISFPGALSPRVVDETFAEQVDLMPTILDLVGAKIPFGVQGRSLAPVLRGERETHKDAVHAEICPPWHHNPYASFEEFVDDWNAKHDTHFPFNIPGEFNKAIRTDRYRYIWYAGGEEELYDLESDPLEQHNVASQPDYRDAKTELKLRLLEWNAHTEDPLTAKTIRILHGEYGDWKNSEVLPGTTTGPYWMEQRFEGPPWLAP